MEMVRGITVASALVVCFLAIGSLGLSYGNQDTVDEARAESSDALSSTAVADLRDFWPSVDAFSRDRPSHAMFETRALALAAASQEEPEPAPLPPFVLGPRQELHAFDDVNGDGRTDLLLIASQPESDEQTISLLNAADLDGAPLWMASALPWSWYVLEDATDDGIADLIVEEFGEPSGNSEGQSVGPAFVYTSSYNEDVEFVVHDGVTGVVAYSLDGGWHHESVDAAAYAQAVYGAGAYTRGGRGTFSFTFLESSAATGGAGGTLLVTISFNDADASVWATEAGAMGYVSGVKASISAYDGHGREQWTTEDAPGVSDTHWATLADGTGDGMLDVLFTDSVAPSPGVWAYAAGQFTGTPTGAQVFQYSLTDGATGEPLWSLLGDPTAAYAEAAAMGDLTGDGASEFGVLEFYVTPGPQGGVETRVLLLDGTDGSSVQDKRYPDEVRYPIPFGDLDGAPGTDLLVLAAHVEGSSPDGWPEYDDFRLLAETASGQLLWERALSEEDLETMEPLLWWESEQHDFTGDGLADLPYVRWPSQPRCGPDEPCLHADYGTPAGFGLISGADGTTPYEADLPEGFDSFVPVADVNGDGAADLVMVNVVPEPVEGTSIPKTVPGSPPSSSAPQTTGTSSSYSETTYVTGTSMTATPSRGLAKPQEPTVFRVTLEARSGSSFESVWQRDVHSREIDGGHGLSQPWVDLENAGDVSGEGGDDVLVSLNDGFGCCVIILYESPEDGTGFVEEGGGVPDGPPGLNRVLVVDSRHGNIHWANPALPEVAPVLLSQEDYTPPPAATGLDGDEPGLLPSPALVMGLAALGIAVLLLRRRT